jgi:hypothetical protein
VSIVAQSQINSLNRHSELINNLHSTNLKSITYCPDPGHPPVRQFQATR